MKGKAETTSSIDAFTYRPELIKTGTVYYYLKSNIDGSYPARIVIYVRDRDYLEVLKFEAHGMDAAYVTAHMDWQTFSADRLESRIITPDGVRRTQASLSSSYEDRTFTIAWQDRTDVVRVGHYPVHIYNFDFISLSYILSHWDHPEGEVKIGILQPNFDPDPETMMKHEGTVLIKFLGNEVRQDTPCRKYSIGGEGLKGHRGVMWVNKEKRIIEDIEIPIADNPDWEDFKFKFISSMHMDSQEWMQFMETKVQTLKSK
jgi:hypothetical protein